MARWLYCGAVALASWLALCGLCYAGDRTLPQPAVVAPGTESSSERPGQPPADAIVLFDGRDLSQWRMQPRGVKGAEPVAPTWKIENGYAEVVPRSGTISTIQKFGHCQIHVEFATPAEVQGKDQSRGNSGVMLHGQIEIQILDSYENTTYADGQCAALYNRAAPLVNVSRGPGQWQTFDIVFESPRLDAKNEVARPARITLFHNGVLVHHAVETAGRSREITLGLQDHLSPVRFRNIWVRKLNFPLPKDNDDE